MSSPITHEEDALTDKDNSKEPHSASKETPVDTTAATPSGESSNDGKPVAHSADTTESVQTSELNEAAIATSDDIKSETQSTDGSESEEVSEPNEFTTATYEVDVETQPTETEVQANEPTDPATTPSAPERTADPSTATEASAKEIRRRNRRSPKKDVDDYIRVSMGMLRHSRAKGTVTNEMRNDLRRIYESLFPILAGEFTQCLHTSIPDSAKVCHP